MPPSVAVRAPLAERLLLAVLPGLEAHGLEQQYAVLVQVRVRRLAPPIALDGCSGTVLVEGVIHFRDIHTINLAKYFHLPRLSRNASLGMEGARGGSANDWRSPD